jgi:hypothetical protein
LWPKVHYALEPLKSMKMHRSSIVITNPFLTCLRQEKHVATFMEPAALAVVRLPNESYLDASQANRPQQEII